MADYLSGLYSNLIRGMCKNSCSGHGDCLNGTCFCEIKFSGSECGGMNLPYHVSLACIYFVVALVSFVQLLISVAMSWQNAEKGLGMTHRIQSAFKMTTPKAIYAIVFLAASLRTAYFAAATTAATSTSSFQPSDFLLSLLSAYYPLLLTGSSLIVCLWAEVFHLANVSFESHRFLSKSFLGFVAFNIVTYSLLLAQLLLVLANADAGERSYYLNVFNACYAVLLLIVVIFFLIYGVEVYFKVRGGFLILPASPMATSSANANAKVNTSQLNQSRLGLVSQASMLLVTVVFLLSDISGEFWKSKVPVESRNTHDIIFRLVEVGVALWFPCVLWNVNRPEQLWILNPKKILQQGHGQGMEMKMKPADSTSSLNAEFQGLGMGMAGMGDDISLSSNVGCYMCYDPDRTDAGALIQPCECRGDVGTVHHECLRKWLLERAAEMAANHINEIPCCSICKTPYNLDTDRPISLKAFSDVSAAHWLRFSLMLTAISGLFLWTWALCHILPNTPYRIGAVGMAIIGVYVILKFWGQNTFSAYKQIKVSAMKIKSIRDGAVAAVVASSSTIHPTTMTTVEVKT